jgi:hypothetical protein
VTAAAPGRPPTSADDAWAALGSELAPAKSLARVDAATARVVSTITVVGTLLTGLGVVGASASSVDGVARVLVAIAVGLSALAVVTALSAQVLTITRRMNPGNLAEVKAWYRGVFARRARLTQAATAVLVLAGLAGGVAGVLIVADSPDKASGTPSMAVVRTVSADGRSADVAVQVRFRGLTPGRTVRASIRDGSVKAEAAILAGPDGVASLALAGRDIPVAHQVQVRAEGGGRTCQGILGAIDPGPVLTCHSE